MTILYRYVTRQILFCFTIVMVAVLSIYLAIDFIEKIDNFMEEGVAATRCLVYLLYKLPFIIVQIAPIGLLLSILIALGLMSKHNEVIALKSCGIGNGRLLVPSLVLGLFFCIGMFVVAETVVPAFMVNANQIWLQEVRKLDVYATKTNDIWMRTGPRIIHIKHYQPDKKRITGVTIYTFDPDFRLVKRVDAAAGEFADGRWQLSDAAQQSFANDSDSNRMIFHRSLPADIDLNPEDLATAAKRSDEMGLAELGEYIKKAEREGYPATRYRVDYQAKIAAPFVCLFLSILGPGIALRGKLREGMSVSITYGLGIAFIYWIFNSFCLSLGYAETMPPVVSAWVANLVFSCVAVVLMLKNS